MAVPAVEGCFATIYLNVLFATCSITPVLLMAAAIVVIDIMLSKNVSVLLVAIATNVAMTRVLNSGAVT